MNPIEQYTGSLEFIPFPKMPRLSRECVITEKIDGTNAQIFIGDDGRSMHVGSRNRWISVPNDNYGFARWAMDNYQELLKLGPGRHFGEWWGNGIQRGYGLPKGDKRFSLFNTSRWSDPAVRPLCCGLVPVLYEGPFLTSMAEAALCELMMEGSQAAPGFMDPEGIVVFHVAANMGFKKTIKGDASPKSVAA